MNTLQRLQQTPAWPYIKALTLIVPTIVIFIVSTAIAYKELNMTSMGLKVFSAVMIGLCSAFYIVLFGTAGILCICGMPAGVAECIRCWRQTSDMMNAPPVESEVLHA